MSGKEPAVVKTIWDAILNDGWMWVVCWGKNRTGKSTLAMQLSYAVYRDWDKVLDSIIFTLNDLFHKIKEGRPERFTPPEGFNRRIPLLIWDDMAVHLNKAASQHDLSVDYFKGYFQAIATDLAVMIGTMLVPTGITLQLHELYTHELFVPERGVYKFDTVRWRPNFGGWQVKPDKAWIETHVFKPVPSDVYKEYNEMRRALTEEVKEKIMDQLVRNLEFIMKRLKPIDYEMLRLLRERGQYSYGALNLRFGKEFSGIRARLKSRGLISAIRKGSKYYYEITELGLELLKYKEKEEISTKEKLEILTQI